MSISVLLFLFVYLASKVVHEEPQHVGIQMVKTSDVDVFRLHHHDYYIYSGVVNQLVFSHSVFVDSR